MKPIRYLKSQFRILLNSYTHYMMIKLSLLEAYLENYSVFVLSLSLIYLNEAIIMWLSLLKAYLE